MACVDKTKGWPFLHAIYWLEWMSKRYEQHQCPKCDKWHVWKRKTKPTNT